MKRYTLLRITAIILEVIGYCVLVGGLLLGLMTFAFSYNVLPPQFRLLPSAIIGIGSFIVWLFTFGHLLIIAHVIQVCLRSHDNTEQILDYLKTEKVIKKEYAEKEDTPLSKWMRENPGRGVNDYYSK